MAPREARQATQRRAVATRWEDIPDEFVREGVRRRGFGTESALLVMNELTRGMKLAPHVHEDFDQIAYIVSGTAVYHVDGVGHEVGPGSLLLIPAGQQHYIEPTGTEPVLNLDVFGPARRDLIHLLGWMRDPRGGSEAGRRKEGESMVRPHESRPDERGATPRRIERSEHPDHRMPEQGWRDTG